MDDCTNETKAMKQSTKTITERRSQFLASWREHAPEASFAGLTLEQFETEAAKPFEIRDRMQAARTQLSGLKIERDLADEELGELFVTVANAIRGDRAFGLDSALYRSLGFVPKSERKRPVRKPKDPADAAEPAPDANAA